MRDVEKLRPGLLPGNQQPKMNTKLVGSRSLEEYLEKRVILPFPYVSLRILILNNIVLKRFF